MKSHVFVTAWAVNAGDPLSRDDVWEEGRKVKVAWVGWGTFSCPLKKPRAEQAEERRKKGERAAGGRNRVNQDTEADL